MVLFCNVFFAKVSLGRARVAFAVAVIDCSFVQLVLVFFSQGSSSNLRAALVG